MNKCHAWSSGETVESQGTLYGADKVRMHPSGRSLYTVTSGLSPADLSKFDLDASPPRLLYDSPYHGDYAMCGDLWMSSDGARIFTGCGTVFHSSESQATDMRYAGTLGLQATWLWGLDSSVARDRIVALQSGQWWDPASDPAIDQSVRHYDYRFLQPTGEQPLPTYDHARGRDRLHGRAVWMNQDGTRYYVIATPAAGHLIGYRTAILEYAF